MYQALFFFPLEPKKQRSKKKTKKKKRLISGYEKAGNMSEDWGLENQALN